MRSADPGDLVDSFLDLALLGQSREAVAITLELLDAGVPEDEIIGDLLAAAQRQVGDGWQRNQLSVADEHVATGAAESALHALAAATPAPASSGLVVVACAEGDWHAVAAHMIAEQLRARGIAVAFLGASTPADHVASFVERRRPVALAISCNLALFYSGVARLADAAHAAGVPVLAGGRALRGGGGARAQRLGADASANDVTDAVATLAAWARQPPPVLQSATVLDADGLELEVRAAELGGSAYGDLVDSFPAMSGYDDRQIARTREDLVFIARFVAASQLVADDLVFTEFLDWLTELLAARGVPAAAVGAGLKVLQPRLLSVSPAAGRLGELGVRHLAQRQ